MRRLTAVGVCLLLSICAVASPVAAETIKVGILDFQRVLENSRAGMAAKEKINQAGLKMEAELKERKAQIEENQKELERESLVMNKQARDDREREIRIQINDFKALQQKYFADFKSREQRLIRQIQEEVFALAEKMGKEQGFSVILEKRESAALYFDPALDITEALIRRYDETAPAETKKTE